MTADVSKVTKPGVLTRVRDLGRPGHLADGIPPPGAFDSRLARLRPRDPVRFRAVDPYEARDLYVACGAVGGGVELA